MVVAIIFVDPLDHFFAPLMLEIDIDIGRLPALGRDEPLEQQLMLDRVDRRDAERKADHRIGCAAASLAEYLLAERELDDRIDREEIGGIAHPLDQPELMDQQILMRL